MELTRAELNTMREALQFFINKRVAPARNKVGKGNLGEPLDILRTHGPSSISLAWKMHDEENGPDCQRCKRDGITREGETPAHGAVVPEPVS